GGLAAPAATAAPATAAARTGRLVVVLVVVVAVVGVVLGGVVGRVGVLVVRGAVPGVRGGGRCLLGGLVGGAAAATTAAGGGRLLLDGLGGLLGLVRADGLGGRFGRGPLRGLEAGLGEDRRLEHGHGRARGTRGRTGCALVPGGLGLPAGGGTGGLGESGGGLADRAPAPARSGVLGVLVLGGRRGGGAGGVLGALGHAGLRLLGGGGGGCVGCGGRGGGRAGLLRAGGRGRPGGGGRTARGPAPGAARSVVLGGLGILGILGDGRGSIRSGGVAGLPGLSGLAGPVGLGGGLGGLLRGGHRARGAAAGAPGSGVGGALRGLGRRGRGLGRLLLRLRLGGRRRDDGLGGLRRLGRTGGRRSAADHSAATARSGVFRCLGGRLGRPGVGDRGLLGRYGLGILLVRLGLGRAGGRHGRHGLRSAVGRPDGRSRGARRGTPAPTRRQGVAGGVLFGALSGLGRFEHAGVSPVRLPGAAPGPAMPVTSTARAMRDGRRPGRGRRTGALCVLSRRFRTPNAHGLAKVFWSVRCPTQVAPEVRGRRYDVRPYAGPSLHRRRRGGS